MYSATHSIFDKSTEGNGVLTTIIAGAIFTGLLALLYTSFSKQRADQIYQSFPQSQIVRPYDINNNGKLESDEMENLMKDYQLSPRTSDR